MFLRDFRRIAIFTPFLPFFKSVIYKHRYPFWFFIRFYFYMLFYNVFTKIIY